MFQNYLKLAYRSLIKNKLYTVLNITGLTVGIVSCYFIASFVYNEMSYDRFHDQYNNLYRIAFSVQLGEDNIEAAVTPLALAPAIKENVVAVADATRITFKEGDVEVDNNSFREKVFYADPNIFTILNYSLEIGDPAQVLSNPYTIVISQSIANKYFGNDDPIGKTIQVNEQLSFTVTGVLARIPENTHLRPDMVASILTLETTEPEIMQNWFEFEASYTYIKTRSDTDIAELKTTLERLVSSKAVDEDIAFFPILQPIQDIHLHSNLTAEVSENGNIILVYILSFVALAIMLLAYANYTNLAITQFIKRTREMGVRGVLGSTRSQTILCFLCESALLLILCVLLSILLSNLIRPYFYNVIGKSVTTTLSSELLLWSGIVVSIALCGLLASFLPAIYLSNFKLTSILKSNKVQGGAGDGLVRKLLIIGQFSIAVALLVCTLVVNKQLQYMQAIDLGFEHEDIAVFENLVEKNSQMYSSIGQEVGQLSTVTHVSSSSAVPLSNTGLRIRNYFIEGEDIEGGRKIKTYDVDHRFFETFGIDIVQGRNFENLYGDSTGVYVLNETAVKQLGLTDPIGHGIKNGSGQRGKVIGVVKDFHFESLQTSIAPLILSNNPKEFSMVSIKSNSNFASSIASASDIIKAYAPTTYKNFFLMDEQVDLSYLSERQLIKIANIFSFVSIFLACFGLLAIAAYTAEQRTKEIGIRKAVGASTFSIVILLSRNFTQLIFISFLLGFPASWFFTNRWLASYPYRIDVGPQVYVLTGLSVVFIAWATIAYESIKAATTDPVRTLRSSD